MHTVRYGGKRGRAYRLAVSPDLVVVRTRSRALLTATGVESAGLSPKARRLLGTAPCVLRFPDAGVEVLRFGRGVRGSQARGRARAQFRREPDVQFAGRVLVDPRSRAPVVYTENFFVKFADGVSPRRCQRLLKEHGLTVKRDLDYAASAFFVSAQEGTGQKIFEIATRLLEDEAVELCHPELVRAMRRREAFADQWHLKATTIRGRRIDAHANVEAAWPLSEGQGITIAIIDDGVDLAHEELASAGKLVAPRDVTRRTNDPRPGNGDHHGTACAGVACADGRRGASGVAPMARLMPIRLVSALGSQAEADAFFWAAQNGADVISCSWGPEDGAWWDASDPLHGQVVPLPDATRLAIDWAIANGRRGRGCVITWAAGNGNESVDNDGYASYEKVIAVAACNDSGRRSAYSDFGRAVWCAFPSSDGQPSLTPGIWTTDRMGAPGYNPGRASQGDAAGNYTNSFGGTSSACPGAAGVAALVLARAPELRWDEVKDVLRRGCDRIDASGGAYDADGHSAWYGYGRLNAGTAVRLASEAPPAPAAAAAYTAVHTGIQRVPIRDLETSTLSVEVGDNRRVAAIRVIVDVEHTYVGDLVVRVRPPATTGLAPLTLHDRTGGGMNDLKRTYDPTNAPDLARVLGVVPQGTWVLEIRDTAAEDTGVIVSWGLELGFP